jgi:transcriptional regulator with XRE-family HTH domain
MLPTRVKRDGVELLYKLFGQAIAEARVKAGITQRELGIELKMGRTNISNIEAGRQRVLLGDVFAFAKALKTTPVKLMREITPS